MSEIMVPRPNKYFLVSGDADDITPLNAFDAALIAAGIGNTNLIKVSSIIAPGSTKIEPVPIPFGSLVPVAYASITSDIPGEIIAAAVAAAVPDDPDMPGVVMEYAAKCHREDAERVVRLMARRAIEIRGCKIRDLSVISAEHKVEKIGAAFAGVVMWW